MTVKKLDVLLIEDDPERGPELERALRAALGRTYGVTRLVTTEAKGSYEQRLLEAIDADNTVLIVTDRDLSEMDSYPGLSEAPVSRVGEFLHLPVCVYASGKSDSFLERWKMAGSGGIILDPTDTRAMARTVCVLAKGFDALRGKAESIGRSKQRRSQYQGPATVLAELLEAPETVDHLALYTRGDQRAFAGLTPGRTERSPIPPKAAARRVARALGVWLYDSVLRFPGVILNEVAAGSFLGIAPKMLAHPEVAKVFAHASYGGLFADPGTPRWWRHRLVELLERKGAADGRALVKAVTGKLVNPCLCSVNDRAPAGFVCVMTGDPVCDEHSVAGVGWLPRGADLARVRRDLFEEVGPFIGMS